MISQVPAREVGSKLTITEEEARQYYAGHAQEFTEPANVTLRQILIEAPATTQKGQVGVNVAQDDDARAQATAIRQRILAGEDFAKVAGEVSMAASKSTGGLIGPINVTELSEPLQKLLQTMKPGQVTQPIRVAKGYQILKLETLKRPRCRRSTRSATWWRSGCTPTVSVRKCASFSPASRPGDHRVKNAELKRAYDQLIVESAKTQG